MMTIKQDENIFLKTQLKDLIMTKVQDTEQTSCNFLHELDSRELPHWTHQRHLPGYSEESSQQSL